MTIYKRPWRQKNFVDSKRNFDLLFLL